MTPALRRLLRVCARELDALGADWAVGGALAMGAHGYVRATRDVDLFVADDVREDLLARLEDDGVVVEDLFPPVHYTVTPDLSDPEARLDLLFPALGVECLGLVAASRARVAGLDVPIVPLAHLVAAKLAVDPDEDPERFAKDHQDLQALRHRGLVDRARVEAVLRDVGDTDAIRRLLRLIG